MTEPGTLLDPKSGPLKMPKLEVVFDILREKFSHNEFDRITEYSCPEMIWASETTIQTDYEKKPEINLLGTG